MHHWLRGMDAPATFELFCCLAEMSPRPSGSFFCSVRFALAILGFFMFIHLYAQRVGMSVAIVCMVNHTTIAATNNAQQQQQAPQLNATSQTVSTASSLANSRCSQSGGQSNKSVSLVYRRYLNVAYRSYIKRTDFMHT